MYQEISCATRTTSYKNNVNDKQEQPHIKIMLITDYENYIVDLPRTTDVRNDIDEISYQKQIQIDKILNKIKQVSIDCPLVQPKP